MFFLGLGSCAEQTVLDIPRREAAQRLKNGDIRFIVNGDPAKMDQIARIHPSAPFYAGLLTESAGDDLRAAALFEAALNSPVPLVRREAAEKLIVFLLEGKASPGDILGVIQKRAPPYPYGGDPAILTLYGAVLYTQGNFDAAAELYRTNRVQSSWDRALSLMASLRSAGNRETGAPGFFLEGPPDRAYTWAFEEIEELDSAPLTGGESAAAAGRLAVSRSAFNESLRLFLTALEQEEGLFTRYPDLLTDLGRTFQFTAYREPGTEILLRWEEELRENPGRDPSGHVRYLLLYFTGRIQRQLDRYPRAIEYFTRALALAPDGAQEDACIWYILQMTLRDTPGEFMPLLRRYRDRWHSDGYFSDILDQFSRYLTARRQWETLPEVLALIRSGSAAAQYAYIIGRAISGGYFTPEGDSIPAEDYFRIALETGNASFYYRALAASHLGENIEPIPRNKDREKGDFPHPLEMDFLLGFFNFGASEFALLYQEKLADQLTIGELRETAKALAESRRWTESIRISTAYMGREDYEPDRRDLELCYPRPYKELIEKYARENEIPVEILYGLIRIESAFTPNIGSRAGARGLTQLMPATAMETAGRIARAGGPNYVEDGEINLYNPVTNIHLGASYLRYLMDRLDSPMLALLAYNGGMGRVRRWRTAELGLPEDLFLETIEFTETRNYGKKVLAAAAAYGYLYYDMTMEAVIADIFK
ncbi:MAG: transglycosylase SLT domain-containing protein [Spirochaetaceae bacterium]|jgi:soluble lytic murein transglycosylase|nr:transglycosylase SLT domain-containing protein [Spirochaetaceae bacterium]